MNYKYLILCFLPVFFACSESPGDAAEKLAQQHFEEIENYYFKLIQIYDGFNKAFASVEYQTRQEARQDLAAKIVSAESDFEMICNSQKDEFESSMKKYKSDSEDGRIFRTTYNHELFKHPIDTTRLVSLREIARSNIMSIQPSLPNNSQIVSDLSGRTLYGVKDSYLQGMRWYLGAEDKVKSLEIYEVNNIDSNNAEFIVRAVITSENSDYNAKIKILYKLGEEWEIDMVEPLEIDIVKTGRYDNSISVDFTKYIMSDILYFTNNTDKALIVGFRTFSQYEGWSKHLVTIPANSNQSHTELSISDYEIDFVERP